VHCQHLNPKPAGGADGAAHGVRDVVQLQIEKYFLPAAPDFFDQSRPFTGKDFQPEFEVSDAAG
jgi:hypothetical protein